MPKRVLYSLAAVLTVVIFFLLITNMHKTVYIIVDGKEQELTTWAITVDQAVAEAQIATSDYDLITPDPASVIWDGNSIIIERAATIQIDVDGEMVTRYAVNPIPSNLIKEAGIQLNPGDKLLDGMIVVPLDKQFETNRERITWELRRAVPFTFQEGSILSTLTSTAPTIGQALWENDITLQAGDEIDPPFNTPLIANQEVMIRRGRPIRIETAVSAVNLLSAADTVSEVINNAGLTLQGLDYTIPPENDTLVSSKTVKIIRVSEEIKIEQTPIPFETSYQAVADLEIDRQTVVEEGLYGLEAQRIRIRYEDGQEVNRQIEETWIAQSPQNQVIGYGTQILMRTIDTPDGPVDYWRALQVYAVSYNPTSAGGNITSTGQKLKKGIIAVNPRYIPYGTVLYIPGYGYGVAADTGNLPPRWIDLGFSDDDYVSWHQNVTIYFVWPPPENIVWTIP